MQKLSLKLSDLANLLESHAKQRDTQFELTSNRPDPLMVAKEYECEYISYSLGSFCLW